MSDHLDLDKMQAAYQAAVEEWIAAIRQEEALASVNHTVAEVDKWEAAHFKEDEIRSKVKAAKKRYEDALREKFLVSETSAKFKLIFAGCYLHLLEFPEERAEANAADTFATRFLPASALGTDLADNTSF